MLKLIRTFQANPTIKNARALVDCANKHHARELKLALNEEVAIMHARGIVERAGQPVTTRSIQDELRARYPGLNIEVIKA